MSRMLSESDSCCRKSKFSSSRFRYFSLGRLFVSTLPFLLGGVLFAGPPSDTPNDKTTGKEEPAKSDSEGSSKSTSDSSSGAQNDASRQAELDALKEQKAREAARKRGEFTFDDLKFEIERGGAFQDGMLTDEIRSLNKKPMRIRGYILPDSVFQREGIKQFVLVRDNKECCFGPGAMLYDCIVVQMDEGKTATFTTRPISVKGRFEIDSTSFQYPDGGYYAIYKLIATEAK